MRLSANWRQRRQRLALTGEECKVCGARLFPPRDVCPHCHEPAYEPFEFGGRGEVYSYSTVYQPPAGYEESAPYTMALIKLEEGPIVTAQLTDMDNDEVRIGMPVEMVTRKLSEDGEDGLIVYGYKFRPVLERAHAR
ncbi:MAG: Zn-ribbon domain-containing OB-fold protein [Chloroflexota bacterium]